MVLKSQAHVIGDIQYQSLTIEKGAYFDARAKQEHAANGREPERGTEELFEGPVRQMLQLSSYVVGTTGPSIALNSSPSSTRNSVKSGHGLTK